MTDRHGAPVQGVDGDDGEGGGDVGGGGGGATGAKEARRGRRSDGREAGRGAMTLTFTSEVDTLKRFDYTAR